MGAQHTITYRPASQSDLPAGPQGLTDALAFLEDIEGVGVARFSAADVVRHALVTRIVAAYQAHESGAKRAKPARTKADRE